MENQKELLEKVLSFIKESELEEVNRVLAEYGFIYDGKKLIGRNNSEEMKDYFLEQMSNPEFFKRLTDYYFNSIMNDPKLSKFKEGDWIIFNELVLFIEKVGQGCYKTISASGISKSYNWTIIDYVARLWTIKDAKDGDILVSKKYDDYYYVFIFKKHFVKNNMNYFMAYGWTRPYRGGDDKEFFANNGGFCDDETFCTNIIDFRPATKSLKDFLFEEIDKAGFIWNPETKTLIEKNGPDKLEVNDRPNTKLLIGCNVNRCGRSDIYYNILKIKTICFDRRQYVCDQGTRIKFDDQDNWRIVSDDENSFVMEDYDYPLPEEDGEDDEVDDVTIEVDEILYCKLSDLCSNIHCARNSKFKARQ